MKKLVVASFLILNISSVFAIGYQPVLSLSMAKKMAESCERLAIKEGWKMNIAIVDNGANLKFFIRQDDSFLKSVELAQQKAITSAGLPFSTKAIAEIATKLPGVALIPGVSIIEGAANLDCKRPVNWSYWCIWCNCRARRHMCASSP